MKATKQSKKVPKKVKRIQSFKDVIQEGFLALFGDDIKMHEQNLFELFALKSDENARLFLDLHTGKLYLHNGVQYIAADYSELPDFLKNGGKGSGKYKHLNENNWRELTDKQRVQEIFEQHYPSAVERVYPTGVTPPDFEAYYIKTANGVNEKSVYLRSVGHDDWRVFFAKSYAGALPVETYSCSEYMLRDLLTGKERRSKTGDLDCCDRLLGIDEVQYLSAFMPNVHEAKRPKALACAEDENGDLVTAYYWKGGKSIACADEDYVTGLFAALEEIARCSVLLEFPEQEEEPVPELPSTEEAQEELAEEVSEAIEEPVEQAEKTEPTAEENEAVETPAEQEVEAEPETAEESAEEAEPEATEAAAAQEAVAEEKPAKKEKRGLFGRRKKHKKEVPAAEAAEPEAVEEITTETIETAQLETIEEPAEEVVEAEPGEAAVAEVAQSEAVEETIEEAETVEDAAQPETIAEPSEQVGEEEPAEVPAAEAAEVEESAAVEEVAAQDAEPAQVQEAVAEEKPAKKEKRGLFGHRKKRKIEVPAAEPAEPAVETPTESVESAAAEGIVTEAAEVEAMGDLSAEPEIIEELAEGIEQAEEPAAEEAEPETVKETAEEIIEAEPVEEPVAEEAEQEATEETVQETAQPEAEIPAEPEEVEAPAPQEAEPETTEEPVEEVTTEEPEKPEAVEAPAAPEPEPKTVEETEVEQAAAVEIPAETSPKAPEQKPLRLKRQKKAAKGTKESGARAADYALPQRISAYAAAGKKKAIKKEILAVLPDCPLIVPISAANIESDKVVYISKQAGVLCGDKIVPFVLMADKVPLLPGEENSEQRQGVMVKTVVNRGKTYIPVFADFKTAVRIFGTSEKFGVFTLKNILSHISHNESVQGITINPGEVNLKLTKENFEENE